MVNYDAREGNWEMSPSSVIPVCQIMVDRYRETGDPGLGFEDLPLNDTARPIK